MVTSAERFGAEPDVLQATAAYAGDARNNIPSDNTAPMIIAERMKRIVRPS
jgi:hypothetical protein